MGAIGASKGRIRAEVQPLVNDLNALLDDRERMVTRALAKAGDLAHGLKTPLAVLAQEASRAEAAGHADLAAAIGAQVDRMSRQVEYHLAHARAAVSGATPGARCSVIASAEGLARTLLRLHAERGLTIDVRGLARSFDQGPPRGSRRDARQSPRQRLQVGALARHHFVDRDRFHRS